MKTSSRPFANVVQATRHLLHRMLHGQATQHRANDDSGSYVGLFQGELETDAAAVGAPRPSLPAQPKPAARTSGFLRLEVNDRKKATGCFLFFVDGKVLTGAIEGASEQTGFVEASFRLNRDLARDSEAAARQPLGVVGRLHLEARHGTGPASGEEMTIRFV